jgi:hypothetical protein
VNPEQPIHLASSTLGKNRHACAFFQNQNQEDGVVIPFIKEGLDRGEKALYISYPLLRANLLKNLSQAGIDVDIAEKRGQLEVKKSEEMYFRDGRFYMDGALAFLQDRLTKAAEQGFPLTRLVSRTEWIIKYRVPANDIFEYEARVNVVTSKFRDPLICVYNLAKFSAGFVMDILRTHPLVIIGKLMAENPFFVPPGEFLDELGQRSANNRSRLRVRKP